MHRTGAIDDALPRLGEQRYLLSRKLAVSVFLAGKLGKPLLVEGERGVGKSELAVAMAKALGTKLVRLQCHAEMSEAEAVFEWNRAGQLLAMLGAAGRATLIGGERCSTRRTSSGGR